MVQSPRQARQRSDWQDPAPLPYLRSTRDEAFDIRLTVSIRRTVRLIAKQVAWKGTMSSASPI